MNRSYVVAAAIAAVALVSSACEAPKLTTNPIASATIAALDGAAFPKSRSTVSGAEYWIGTAEDRPSDTAQCAELFKPYMRPEMMAIGDSLYNGVSSFRINWWLSEWSVPAQVAIPLGLIHQTDYRRDFLEARTFWVPQYPPRYRDDPNDRTYGETSTAGPLVYDFGLDLEGVSLGKVTNAYTFTSMLKDMTLLSEQWLPPNGRLFNDNIAFFGSDTTDMLKSSSSSLSAALELPTYNDDTGEAEDRINKQLAEVRAQIRNNALNAGTPLINAFIAKNGAFVLNPMRHPCVKDLTSIGQVKLRQPKRLLINVGSNNGVWKAAFDPRPGFRSKPYRRYPWVHEVTNFEQHVGEIYRADMDQIINELSAVEGLEFVYINSMMPPSRAANLMPSDKDGNTIWEPGTVGENGYYDYYKPVFSLGQRYVVKGRDIFEADKKVRESNDRLKAMIDAANQKTGRHPKFVYVDLDAFSGEFDYKHRGDKARRIGVAPEEGLGTTAKPIMWLDNRALKFDQPVLADHRRFSNLASGGFFSYDNMHLTTAGYGLLAVTLLGAIRQNEPDAVKNEEYYWQAMGLIHPATHVAQDLWQSETILRMGTRRDDLDRESIFILLPTVAQH